MEVRGSKKRKIAGKMQTAVCPSCLRVWRVPHPSHPQFYRMGSEPRCCCGTNVSPDVYNEKVSIHRRKNGLVAVLAAKSAHIAVQVYRGRDGV